MRNENAHGPGDLGRRVAARRQELGLSRAQLANLAGMAASYIGYLEQHPANVGNGGLMRLVGALATTPDALLGGGSEAAGEAGRVSVQF
jgi:transcriptional regulator with XRE-family HTH domain